MSTASFQVLRVWIVWGLLGALPENMEYSGCRTSTSFTILKHIYYNHYNTFSRTYLTVHYTAPSSFHFITQMDSRLCSTSQQWTRCKKLLQCYSCTDSWELLEIQNWICYQQNRQILVWSTQTSFIMFVLSGSLLCINEQEPQCLQALLKAPKSLIEYWRQHCIALFYSV